MAQATAWKVKAAQKVQAMDDASLERLLRRRFRAMHGRGRRLPRDGGHHGYTPEEDRLLGTMSDVRVAEVLGRTKNSVRKRRVRLGIRPSARRAWDSDEDALLGRYADSEVARRLCRSYGSVQARRLKLGIKCFHSEFTNRTAEQDRWFGGVALETIARRTGRSLAAVRRRGSKVRPELFPPPKPAPPKWTQDQVRALGTATDRELARRLGRTRGRRGS